MANKDVEKHIASKKMLGADGKPWDPNSKRAFPQRGGGPKGPIDGNAIGEWAGDWQEFGRRVRRDILALEKLLVVKKLIVEADLYGDPGDPPPPPDV